MITPEISAPPTSSKRRRLYARVAIKPLPEGLPDERGWMMAPTDQARQPFAAYRAHAFFDGVPCYRSFRDEESARAFMREENARAIALDPKRAEPLLTSRQLCKRLHITMQTLKDRRDSQVLPFTKISRNIHLYRWSEVCTALEANREAVRLPEKVYKVEKLKSGRYPFRVRGSGNEKHYCNTEEEADALARKLNSAVGRKPIAPLPQWVRGMAPDEAPYRLRPYNAQMRPDLHFEVTAYLGKKRKDGSPQADSWRFRTAREALQFANQRNFEVARQQCEEAAKSAAASLAAAKPALGPKPSAESAPSSALWSEAELTLRDRQTMRRKPFLVFRNNDQKGGRYPWIVRGMINGSLQRKYFTGEAAAKQFAHMRNTEAESQGTDSLIFPAWLRVLAQRCQAQLQPYERSIDDATRHYIEFLERSRRSCSYADLLARCVESKKASGVTSYYVSDLKKRLGLFGAFIGPETIVSEITTAQVDEYLASLTGMGAVSRNSVRRMLGTFFNYAMVTGNRADNPAKHSVRAKETETPVGIITPDQLGKLLAHAPAEVVPFIAIGAFAGLRVAELQRLDWAQVDLADGFIEITAKNAKSARRRIVKILPALDAWIRPLAKQSGPVWPYRSFIPSYHLAAPSAAAGIVAWPRNALRHSFASYHIAQFKDAAALALELGHTTTNLIFQHYRQVVRQAEAAKYWDIRPAGMDGEKVVNFTPAAAQA